MEAATRQLPINGNRRKEFSAGPYQATVAELFSEVSSVGLCEAMTEGLFGEMFST
jgi:hypothetical protein